MGTIMFSCHQLICSTYKYIFYIYQPIFLIFFFKHQHIFWFIKGSMLILFAFLSNGQIAHYRQGFWAHWLGFAKIIKQNLSIRVKYKVHFDQRNSALKNHLKFTPPLPLKKQGMAPSEIAFLSNSRWQNRKERPNRSTNSGHMVEIAKRPVGDGMREWVCDIYVIREKPSCF